MNFRIHAGAIRKMIDFFVWALPFIFHCLYHRLELGTKDAYESYNMFKKKEMLHILHRLFIFTKVGGTRFQGHTKCIA